MPQVKTIGVVGGGTMGHGIAQVSAQAGLRTLLYDVSRDRVDAALAKVQANLEAGVVKGKLTPELRAAAQAQLSGTARLDELAACDLVIEAVPEDLALKQQLFSQLSSLCRPDAVLATNTSSISVGAIAQAATSPGRVLGMHFFNPVYAMRLLELVRAEHTSAEALDTARQVAVRMGKEVVEVLDRPGFASTRLGIALGMEAIRMVEEGVASPADIDRAMELGYGHPMGPLKLTDLVGLDVRLKIAQYLHRELKTDAFRPPRLLERMVEEGKLGRKSGEGFYRY